MGKKEEVFKNIYIWSHDWEAVAAKGVNKINIYAWPFRLTLYRSSLFTFPFSVRLTVRTRTGTSQDAKRHAILYFSTISIYPSLRALYKLYIPHKGENDGVSSLWWCNFWCRISPLWPHTLAASLSIYIYSGSRHYPMLEAINKRKRKGSNVRKKEKKRPIYCIGSRRAKQCAR